MANNYYRPIINSQFYSQYDYKKVELDINGEKINLFDSHSYLKYYNEDKNIYETILHENYEERFSGLLSKIAEFTDFNGYITQIKLIYKNYFKQKLISTEADVKEAVRIDKINNKTSVPIYNNTKNLLRLIQLCPIINYLRPEVRNKLIVIGTGNFIGQIFPKPIIDDINNNSCWDVIIIEDCGDDGFGCPNQEIITNEINQKITDQTKRGNVHFYHFKMQSSIEAILAYLLLMKHGRNDFYDRFIIYDTIGSGHHLPQYINEYNEILSNLKFLDQDFSQIIEEKKIIPIVETGNKLVYYSYLHKNFVGCRTEKPINNCKKIVSKRLDNGSIVFVSEDAYCGLNLFTLNQLLDLDVNSPTYDSSCNRSQLIIKSPIIKNISQTPQNGGYLNKYLKYKQKYLELKQQLKNKKLFNPNN
jgi:hypothetical protein